MKKPFKRLPAGLCLTVLAGICLSGCAAKQAPELPWVEPSAAITAEPAAAPEPAPEETVLGEATRTAYKTVVADLLNRHVLPDGTDLGHDEFSDPAGNQFALCDVDLDGRKELILVYTTTAMAGQTAAVYDYDEANGQLYAELTEYPLLTFYDNGVIKAGWSHNQGLAGSFWPYALYRYDGASDVYAAVGMVDAWEKAFAATDFSGNSYPEDVDVSGTGFVYYLIEGGEYREVPPVDASTYESWANGYLSGASELIPAYMTLTKENLEAVLGA